MKNIFLLMLVSFAFVGLSADLFAEPYAKKIEITSNTSPMSKMVIDGANVPNRASVSIPPYPGAEIFQTRDAGEMGMNDETVKTIAYIKLLSTDPVDQVVAWYKEQLEGYSFGEFYGVSWVFWEGQGEFNAFDITQTTTIQNVMIADATTMDYDQDMKGAKSSIEVSYK